MNLCNFKPKLDLKTNMVLITSLTVLTLLASARLGVCVDSNESGKVGVLIMAHGGSTGWNTGVENAAAPLRAYCPTVVAFGMADPASLQQAVEELEDLGVTQIAVVRLFISATSFKHQTEYLLGLRPEPPAMFVHHDTMRQEITQPEDNAATKNNHRHVTPPIQKKASVILSQKGLADSPSVGEILAERVQTQSLSPKNESVLILAHGVGSDDENSRWLSKINKLANNVREVGSFRAVTVETLREDWKDKRKVAEQRIRNFVQEGNQDGGRVIVVPFRVFGFGPYGDVLEGLKYTTDGLGLLPHPKATDWLKEQASDCFSRANWLNPFVGNQK